MSATLLEKAPAKINLTLRVLGRRADGYHELESLVAFADVADTLTLSRVPRTGWRSPGHSPARADQPPKIWFSRRSLPCA